LIRTRPSAEPGARFGSALLRKASAYSMLRPAPTLSQSVAMKAIEGWMSKVVSRERIAP
jgi:hypothetical protein